MPSKESNTPETNNENVVKFKPSKEKVEKSPKKNNPITLTKVVTYVILGLLALVLIGWGVSFVWQSWFKRDKHCFRHL